MIGKSHLWSGLGKNWHMYTCGYMEYYTYPYTSSPLDYAGQWRGFPRLACLWWIYAAAVRIGEAKNPGPKACSVITVNISSWETGGMWVLKHEADVILVQETKLGVKQSRAAYKEARNHGWHSNFEPGYFTKEGQIGGGVAILVKKPRRMATIKVALADQLKGRYARAAVSVNAKDVVHFGVVYGFDGSQLDASMRNTELHA